MSYKTNRRTRGKFRAEVPDFAHSPNLEGYVESALSVTPGLAANRAVQKVADIVRGEAESVEDGIYPTRENNYQFAIVIYNGAGGRTEIRGTVRKQVGKPGEDGWIGQAYYDDAEE